MRRPNVFVKSVNCPNARSIVAWLTRVVMGSPCPEMSNAFPGTNLIVLGGADRGTTREQAMTQTILRAAVEGFLGVRYPIDQAQPGAGCR